MALNHGGRPGGCKDGSFSGLGGFDVGFDKIDDDNDSCNSGIWREGSGACGDDEFDGGDNICSLSPASPSPSPRICSSADCSNDDKDHR